MVPEGILFFMHQALDGMMQIAEELGDERVNQPPDLPEANSPYVILAHCVGLTHYWIGEVLAGRQVHRDREAEFSAQGTVAEMRQAVRDLQAQLQEDITHVQVDQPLAHPLAPRHQQRMQDWRQGMVLLQCCKELAQHHGHMDLTRDLLMRQ